MLNLIRIDRLDGALSSAGCSVLERACLEEEAGPWLVLISDSDSDERPEEEDPEDIGDGREVAKECVPLLPRCVA